MGNISHPSALIEDMGLVKTAAAGGPTAASQPAWQSTFLVLSLIIKVLGYFNAHLKQRCE